MIPYRHIRPSDTTSDLLIPYKHIRPSDTLQAHDTLQTQVCWLPRATLRRTLCFLLHCIVCMVSSCRSMHIGRSVLCTYDIYLRVEWRGLKIGGGNLIHRKVVVCIFRCQSIWLGISGDNLSSRIFWRTYRFQNQVTWIILRKTHALLLVANAVSHLHSTRGYIYIYKYIYIIYIYTCTYIYIYIHIHPAAVPHIFAGSIEQRPGLSLLGCENNHTTQYSRTYQTFLTLYTHQQQATSRAARSTCTRWMSWCTNTGGSRAGTWRQWQRTANLILPLCFARVPRLILRLWVRTNCSVGLDVRGCFSRKKGVWVWGWVRVWLCEWVRVCMCVYIYIYMYISLYIYICIHIYIHIYQYVCIYLCIYTYIYTCIHM